MAPVYFPFRSHASGRCRRAFSSLCSPSRIVGTGIGDGEEWIRSQIGVIKSRIPQGCSDDEVFKSLELDEACNAIPMSQNLVDRLLHRFKDDWKSALGFFRWAGSRLGYEHAPEAYDMMVDLLGKLKQVNKMRALMEEMRQKNLVRLSTVAKAMRRLAGAGEWENAVRLFDDLGKFDLKKDTESMNVLLDTLCKEKKVAQARKIFLELKAHIPPNAHTFNIFVHGWCKSNRVDEAEWTIQEMKGHGCHPCVISYSTLIQAYCHQCDFGKVYKLLDDMKAQGCVPNVVTYTTIMHSLTKTEQFKEALQIAERMRLVGCEPDTLFYNALIHTLGRAGKLREALHAFKVEMPRNGVPPNTSTYNSMIAMFCHRSEEQMALDLLNEIENSTLCKPDIQTYYPILKSCFKSGKIDSLMMFLDDMFNKHNLSLDVSAYTLLIHGFCRANKCDQAYNLFEEMIGKEMTPRYKTCAFLLDEIKQMNMHDAAERIEAFMKRMKAPE